MGSPSVSRNNSHEDLARLLGSQVDDQDVDNQSNQAEERGAITQAESGKRSAVSRFQGIKESCTAKKVVIYSLIAFAILAVIGILIAIGLTGGFGHAGALQQKVIPWIKATATKAGDWIKGSALPAVREFLNTKTHLLGMSVKQVATGVAIGGGAVIGGVAIACLADYCRTKYKNRNRNRNLLVAAEVDPAPRVERIGRSSPSLFARVKQTAKAAGNGIAGAAVYAKGKAAAAFSGKQSEPALILGDDEI